MIEFSTKSQNKMKHEFLETIHKWKNQKQFFESKKVWRLSSSIKSNEYLLLIEVSTVCKFNGFQEKVEISRYFQTLAQNDSELNSNGDIFRIKKLFEHLDLEFACKIEKSINNHLFDINTSNKKEI